VLFILKIVTIDGTLFLFICYKVKLFRKMSLIKIDSGGLLQDPVAVFCEGDIDPSGSIKGGDFLDELSNCQILKESLQNLVTYYVTA
jgi:hypothetical protein